jgi:RimJ/RimL family protein N-acetyltransferase
MTVVVETERLFLRELLLNDIEPLAAILGSPEVTRHIAGPRDANAVRRWIQDQQASYREHGYGHWAVIHRESATLVGYAGLEGERPELGCVLDEPYWRLGLATEILSAVRDHAFTSLGVEALSARVSRKNKAGKKLAAALGLRLDHDGDELVYAVHRGTS